MRHWAVALWLAVGPMAAVAQTIADARFAAPTDRYAHGILGDAIEWGALEIDVMRDGQLETLRIDLPENHVFEDVAPRLWDITGDGAPEVVVVETDVAQGGALAIYGPEGKLDETPHIGKTNRWLAPIGAADLDGDGVIEIAYIDRPHLAKTLRVWRYRDGRLRHAASIGGLTNHRIGERDIAGGIRTCAGAPEMVLATADWSRLVAVRFDGAAFEASTLAPQTDRARFARALNCE